MWLAQTRDGLMSLAGMYASTAALLNVFDMPWNSASRLSCSVSVGPGAIALDTADLSDEDGPVADGRGHALPKSFEPPSVLQASLGLLAAVALAGMFSLAPHLR
jgi:hypothetical protein